MIFRENSLDTITEILQSAFKKKLTQVWISDIVKQPRISEWRIVFNQLRNSPIQEIVVVNLNARNNIKIPIHELTDTLSSTCPALRKLTIDVVPHSSLRKLSSLTCLNIWNVQDSFITNLEGVNVFTAHCYKCKDPIAIRDRETEKLIPNLSFITTLLDETLFSKH